MSALISPEAKTLLDSLPEPAFVVSLEKTLVAMNAAGEVLTGMSAAAGRRCAEVVRCEACGESCPLDAAVAQGRAVTNFNVQLTSAHGEQAVSLHTALLR